MFLVRRDSPADRIGRFELPENCRKQPASGVVVAAGRARTLPAILAGARILFAPHSAREIQYAGESYLLVSRADVLGGFDDTPTAA